MSLASLFASARVNRSASLFIAMAILMSCERAKSPPPEDTSRLSATQEMSALDTSRPRVVPESSPEAMGAFAASQLPRGKKAGEFLTDKADYPTGDTADVYRAVLDSLYVSKGGFPGQVVLYDVASP